MIKTKVSINVWNKYSATEKQLFQELIPLAGGVNEIKSFITAIKKRFGTVEDIVVHKMGCVIVNNRLSFWSNDNKRWTDTDIEPMVSPKVGDLISFNTCCNADQQTFCGIVSNKDQLGLITIVEGVQYELSKLVNMKIVSSNNS